MITSACMQAASPRNATQRNGGMEGEISVSLRDKSVLERSVRDRCRRSRRVQESLFSIPSFLRVAFSGSQP